MDLNDVIIKPLVTEKSTRQQQLGNTYSFRVHNDATKPQIKQAVEKIYEVKVTDVRTLKRKGKPKRTRTRVIHTGEWKRAIVTLDENSKIELF
jgi:large subunit ribosomal protein L23